MAPDRSERAVIVVGIIAYCMSMLALIAGILSLPAVVRRARSVARFDRDWPRARLTRRQRRNLRRMRADIGPALRRSAP